VVEVGPCVVALSVEVDAVEAIVLSALEVLERVKLLREVLVLDLFNVVVAELVVLGREQRALVNLLLHLVYNVRVIARPAHEVEKRGICVQAPRLERDVAAERLLAAAKNDVVAL